MLTRSCPRVMTPLLFFMSLWPLSAAAQSSATLPDAPASESSSAGDPPPLDQSQEESSVVPPPAPEEVPLREATSPDDTEPRTPPPSSDEAASSDSDQGPRFAELHGETRVKRDYRSMSDDELREAYGKTGKAGPTVMAVVGGVILSGAGPLFLIGGIAGISCAANNLPCYGIGTFIGVTGGLTAVGGSMLIGGVLWVDHRKDNRRAITNEMARREKEGAASEIKWGLMPRSDGAALALHGTF